MKKITTLVAVMCLCFAASAQYYYYANINAGHNPGSLNSDAEYPVGGGLPAGWTNLNTPPNASPVWTANQTIGFTFSFNGAPVTQFKVASSGVLTFDVATALPAPSYTRAALPNASIPDNSVCIWGLNAMGANDYIIMKTFGTSPNRQLWIQFNSYGYGNVASDGSNFTYWSIVLQETTNNIYIVDNRTGGFTGTNLVSAGIQLNSTTAYSITGSPNLASNATTDPTPADNTYYQFINGTMPQYDASIQTQNLQYYLQGNVNQTVSGILTNFGSSTLTSLRLNYSVNGGPAVSSNVSSINVATSANYNYTHSIPWNPSSAGTYTMKIWADNLNGNNDQNHSNDTLTASFLVLDSLQTMTPIFEEFTQASCDPCANATPNLDATLTAAQNICNVVRYHVNWPGVDYMNNETQTPFVNARVTYYNVTGVPDAKLNGSTDSYPGTVSLADIQAEVNKGSPVKMTMTSTWDQVSNHYAATINVKSFAPMAAGLKCYVALTVDTIKYFQNQSSETIAQYDFKQVAEDMMPSSSGTTLTAFTSGQTQTVNVNWAQNRPWGDQSTGFYYDSTVTNCFVHLTAWVQNNTSKYCLQSVTSIPSILTGVNEVSTSATSLGVYPNPANNSATVQFQLANSANAVVTVTNVMGQVVYQNNLGTVGSGITRHSLNTENFSDGIYNVTLQAGDKLFSHKFVISR